MIHSYLGEDHPSVLDATKFEELDGTLDVLVLLIPLFETLVPLWVSKLSIRHDLFDMIKRELCDFATADGWDVAIENSRDSLFIGAECE